MTAPSDPSATSTAWPPARPVGISPIQHPAWEEARNAVLDLAAEGPVTAIIVGEPGTGKSWLLRELAGSLGDHGFPTMMLMQGNLPMALSDGAALLVDDASLMEAATRAEMVTQQRGVVVLAGAEWFEDELDPASRTPVIIELRPLLPAEIADFAAEWLDRAGLTDSVVGAAMLSRLTAESGGRVAAIVRLLGESATSWQNFPLAAPAEAAAPILAALPPEPQPEPEPELELLPEPPPAAPVLHTPRRRRATFRPLLAGSAIAAAIVLGWVLIPKTPPADVAQSAAPAPVVADSAAPGAAPQPQQSAAAAPPSLPPLRQAEIPGPALAAAADPAQPPIAAPPLAAAPSPELHATDIPVDTQLPATSPAIAAAAPPPVLAPTDPAVIATLDDPAVPFIPAAPEQHPASNRVASPGLVLIAQRGDTLERLYGDVYRDRRAPPFATVLAANPGPFRPGAIVVFPEPPGGWQRVQR